MNGPTCVPYFGWVVIEQGDHAEAALSETRITGDGAADVASADDDQRPFAIQVQNHA